MICDFFGWDFGDIMEENIKKLKKDTPRVFLKKWLEKIRERIGINKKEKSARNAAYTKKRGSKFCTLTYFDNRLR